MTDLDAELANFEAELASLAAATETVENNEPPSEPKGSSPVAGGGPRAAPPGMALPPPPVPPPSIPPPPVPRRPATLAAPPTRAVIAAAPATTAPPIPPPPPARPAYAEPPAPPPPVRAPASGMTYPTPPAAPPPVAAPPAPGLAATQATGVYPGSAPAMGEEPKEKVALLREAAGKRWVDKTLLEWPDNDFRIFVGNLGNEVSDTVLTAAFQNYGSFNMARIVRNSWNKKSKGYGFASFSDPTEGARVLKEMQGAYIGNRPVQLKKSTWDDRQVTDKRTGKPIKRMVEEKERKPDKKARQETFQPRQFYQGRH